MSDPQNMMDVDEGGEEVQTTPTTTTDNTNKTATVADDSTMDVDEVDGKNNEKKGFVDENGRRVGKVLWYNGEKGYGIVIPEDPEKKMMKVMKIDIVSESEDDSIRALQKNQIVKYSTDDDISAKDVKTSEEKPIDFSVKVQLPRYILPPNPRRQNGAPNGTSEPQKPSPPQLKVDSEVIVKGKVTHWADNEGWGFIQPDGDFKRIVVERAEIESECYPGLELDLRVQFRVIDGPYVGSVAASDVFQEGGSKIVYEAEFMKNAQIIEPNSDEVHKGKITYFGGRDGKPYGFIQPEGTETREAQVFVHVSQTRWMPLVLESEVEYKLGTNKKGQPTAVCVTGPNGGDLEFERPKRRPRSQQQKLPTPQPMGYGGGGYGMPYPQHNYGSGYPMVKGFRGQPNAQKKKKKRKLKTDSDQPTTSFVCSLCSCSMTCEAAYNDHINGKQHQKKLKLSSASSTNPTTTSETTNDTTATNTTNTTDATNTDNNTEIDINAPPNLKTIAPPPTAAPTSG